MEDRVSIHFSVEDGIIEVEQKKGPLISRKEISRDQLLNCFRKSVYIREDAPPVLSSGFLPLNTLAVRQTKESVSVVVWYPRLRADLSLYKTPYPDFPIPRLVFGFSVGAADGAVSACRIGVIADETPTPDTIMYHYPFSNVDSSCVSGPTRSLNIRNCEKQPDFPHCCSAFPITLTGLIRPTTNWALTIGI